MVFQVTSLLLIYIKENIKGLLLSNKPDFYVWLKKQPHYFSYIFSKSVYVSKTYYTHIF